MKKLLPLLLLILIGCSKSMEDSELTENISDGLFYYENKVYNGTMFSSLTSNDLPRRKGKIKDGQFDGRWSFILEEDSNSYSELILNYSSGKLLEEYHYLYKHNIEEKTSILEKLLLIDKNSITVYEISRRENNYRESGSYNNYNLFNSKSLRIEKINGDFNFSFLSRKKYPPLEWDPKSENYKLYDYFKLVDSKENNTELIEYTFIENSNPSNIETPIDLIDFEPKFSESSQNDYKLDEKYTLLKEGNDGEWLEYLWEGYRWKREDEKKYHRKFEKIFLGNRTIYKDGKVDIHESFYPSGKISSRKFYNNGILEKSTSYYRNGIDIISESIYLNGTMKMSGFDVDGNLTYEESYKNGLLNGPFTKFENGQLVEKGNYKDGELDGSYSKTYKSGLYEEGYYKDGVGFLKGYRDGVLQGERRTDCDINYIKRMLKSMYNISHGNRVYDVTIDMDLDDGSFIYSIFLSGRFGPPDLIQNNSKCSDW